MLDETARKRVADAVAAAEAHTSGEIVCIVERRLDPDPLMPWLVGALAALALPPVVITAQLALGEGWQAGGYAAASASTLAELVLLQVLCFGGGWALTRIAVVRRFVTPRAVRRRRVHDAAMRHFVSRGVHQTRDRTGVLVFVVEDERMAEIVADEGIHQKVKPVVWAAAIDALVAGVARGEVAQGFEAAIAKCGEVLAEHFPPRPDDIDELANRLVVLD